MAIELNNEFVLAMPPEEAWALLTDIERIAPCVPGAQLTGVEGNAYRGKVRVKLGPITADYAGVATIMERDDAARRLVVEGKGRDVRGQGTAGANVVMSVVPDGSSSRVRVQTSVQLTGKIASLGRSVMNDVAKRLIDQFVENLGRLETARTEPAPDSVPRTLAADPVVTERRIESPEPAPVDLLAVGGSALLGGATMVALWRVAVLVLLLLILLK